MTAPRTIAALEEPTSQQRRLIILRSMLWALATAALLVALYYLLPMDTALDTHRVLLLTLYLVAFGAISVFSTVGFGDIVPKADPVRLIVTGQMFFDLILFGLGARIFIGAVELGRQRRTPRRSE